MKLRAVSCSHQRAALAVREKLAFPNSDRLQAGYAEFRRRFPEVELVILSTCNRVELYYSGDAEQMPTLPAIAQFLADTHQIPLDDFLGELAELQGTAVATHLFSVTASLDSMVLGEPQIVNQVKQAYRSAEEHQACGPMMHALFQAAIRASSRVRSETKLSEGRVSIASVAVGEFARGVFGDFADKQVLVIGAGEMAEETVRYLQSEGGRQLRVINRNRERAEKLAAEWGGVPAPWEELDRWLGKADVIVSTTGADEPIVDVARFRAARQTGRSRPVFILDLGAPRDFAPEISTLEDVFLYDIDSLRQTCESNRRARHRELERAQLIVQEEVDQLAAECHRRVGSDVVVRLREEWHLTSHDELEGLFRKMPHLSESDRETIARAVERIVNKLLHPPLEALRDESRHGSPQGLLEALRRLFRL